MSCRKAQRASPKRPATRFQKVIKEEVEARLAEVETTAARAVDAARGASDRLTEQMLSIGRTARHSSSTWIRSVRSSARKDSEAFARRVALLIDSMHSASIDVGKILSDEVDEKAWDSYLKGNRGVFTRRAVRLLEGSETRCDQGALRSRHRIPARGPSLRPRLRGNDAPRRR
jgi:hypothetical protein